jgi:hypothetical protein
VNALASRPQTEITRSRFAACVRRFATQVKMNGLRARRSLAVGQRSGAAECLADPRGGARRIVSMLSGWAHRETSRSERSLVHDSRGRDAQRVRLSHACTIAACRPAAARRRVERVHSSLLVRFRLGGRLVGLRGRLGQRIAKPHQQEGRDRAQDPRPDEPPDSRAVLALRQTGIDQRKGSSPDETLGRILQHGACGGGGCRIV